MRLGKTYRPRKLMASRFAGGAEFFGDFAVRRDREIFATISEKFVDVFFKVHYSNNIPSVMPLLLTSQKISVTRYCGLKGGIVDGD